MQRFTLVLVMMPESILSETQAWTPDWSCCLEKKPCSSASSLPTNQVTRATERDVSGSYKHAFFLNKVFRISDDERWLFAPG